jgi:hypothetical protein
MASSVIIESNTNVSSEVSLIPNHCKDGTVGRHSYLDDQVNVAGGTAAPRVVAIHMAGVHVESPVCVAQVLEPARLVPAGC